MITLQLEILTLVLLTTSITSLYSDNSTVIGIGTEFCDNVYAVDSVELVSRSVAGVNTTVKRVFANVTNAPTGIVGIVTSPVLVIILGVRLSCLEELNHFLILQIQCLELEQMDVTGISTSTKTY